MNSLSGMMDENKFDFGNSQMQPKEKFNVGAPEMIPSE
jgi:hypothetical protein